MFGITDDSNEHFLAGPGSKVAVAPQFAAKPDTLKWRNGYLGTDLEANRYNDNASVTLKKGTTVRVYEGSFPKAALGEQGADATVPGPKGNWIVELAPTASNVWMFYPAMDAKAPTTADLNERGARVFLAPQDPLDLVPLAEGADKTLTDEAFNAIGTGQAPPLTTSTNTPPPPPKKEEASGLGTLAVAGGLLWLLSQKGK